MSSWREIAALPPTRTVAPTISPVSLAELKLHVRVDQADDDAILEAMLNAATAFVENRTGLRLAQQTWTQSFSGLADRLYLTGAPVSSVSSISYYDTANAAQTLTSSLYRLVAGWDGVYVEQDSDSTYPETYTRADAVTVTFVAGFGTTAGSIPDDLRQAVKLIVGHWYETREDAMPMEQRPIPNGAAALMAAHRRGWT